MPHDPCFLVRAESATRREWLNVPTWANLDEPMLWLLAEVAGMLLGAGADVFITFRVPLYRLDRFLAAMRKSEESEMAKRRWRPGGEEDLAALLRG